MVQMITLSGFYCILTLSLLGWVRFILCIVIIVAELPNRYNTNKQEKENNNLAGEQ